MDLAEIQKAAQQLQNVMPPAGVPLIKGNGVGQTLTNSEIQEAVATIKRRITAEIKRWAQVKAGSVEEQALKCNLPELINQSNAIVMIGQAVARGQY